RFRRTRLSPRANACGHHSLPTPIWWHRRKDRAAAPAASHARRSPGGVRRRESSKRESADSSQEVVRPTHEDSIGREPARRALIALTHSCVVLASILRSDRNAIPLPEAIVISVGEVTTTAGAVRGHANLPVGI